MTEKLRTRASAQQRVLSQNEKTTAECEQIFANHLPDKRLISKIYFKKFNSVARKNNFHQNEHRS